ncbi:MAG: NADH-quinone oxidoreductase subunit C [Deltaproteobacteria bacterium]|nr:NADH-quinone oxidoreductase subunit C [Deltaproteobacteria bacterium]
MENAKIAETVKGKFGDAVLAEQECCDDLQLVIKAEALLDVMRFLHDDEQLAFDLLIDVLSIDNSQRRRKPRFEVVYVLVSTTHLHRLLVKVPVADELEVPEVPTVTGIWHAAMWAEREVYDLMGIRFADHPDLRRILTWDGFEGHPLRKEFPVEGKDFDKKWDPDTIEVL